MKEPMKDRSPNYFHLSKVARILKVSKPLVLRMVRSGELPSIRTPKGLRVEEAQLGEWIEAQRVAPVRE